MNCCFCTPRFGFRVCVLVFQFSNSRTSIAFQHTSSYGANVFFSQHWYSRLLYVFRRCLVDNLLKPHFDEKNEISHQCGSTPTMANICPSFLGLSVISGELINCLSRWPSMGSRQESLLHLVICFGGLCYIRSYIRKKKKKAPAAASG